MNARHAAAFLALFLALAWMVVREPATGSVAGVVVVPGTDAPLSGLTVTLASDDDELRARTDRSGRFQFPRVTAGKYVLSCFSEHHKGSAKVAVGEATHSERRILLMRTETALSATAGQQTIFTTRETPRLPIQGYASARADTPLQLTLYRTRLSTVLALPGGAEALETLQRQWDGSARAFPKALAPLTRTPFTTAEARVTTIDRERYFVERVPFPAAAQRRPGLYLARIDYDGTSVCTWTLSTDMALVSKRGVAGTSLAYVTDLTSGRPLADVTVRQGTRIARTDRDGLASLPPGDESAAPLVAVRGDDEATLRLGGVSSENDGGLVVHIDTDRPVYRPGQIVHYRGVARRRLVDAARYAVPTGQTVTIAVRDPSSNVVYQSSTTLSARGSFFGEFRLSAEGETGSYALVTAVAGETHTADIAVSAYRKPEMEVHIATPKARVLRGDTVTATIDAKYYFGAPVAGGTVRWSVLREADWSAEFGDGDALWSELDDDERHSLFGAGGYGETAAEGEGRLGPDGTLTVTFPADVLDPDDDSADPDALPQEHVFTLTASVSDEARREAEGEVTVRVSAGDLVLTVQPNGYLGAVGTPTTVFVAAHDHRGTPAPNIAITLGAATERWDSKRSEMRRVAQEPPQTATTGADGRAVFTLTPSRTGSLRLTATAKDAAGHPLQGRALLAVAGDAGDEDTHESDVTLLTDKRRYEPGETARVLVRTSDPGQHVLVTVESDRVRAVYPVQLTERSAVLTIPVRAEYGPNVTLAACYVRQKRFAQSTLPLRVAQPRRGLRIAITPERARYEPRQSAAFDVAITDAAGKPVATEFAFGLVDEAIYAIRPDSPRALIGSFYPRRSNLVQTRHSFEVGYLSADDKDGPQVTMRRDFRDTAYWNPSLATDATGHARVVSSLPDNLTTWRASVKAVSDETAVGYATAKIAVAQPFFVRLEAPRFAIEGDRLRLMALVHNDTGSARNVTVRLKAPGFALDGAPTQTLSVEAGAVGTVVWPVTARFAGEARVALSAWTADRRFTDGLEQTLRLRPFARERVTQIAGIAPGGRVEREFTVAADAALGRTQLQLRITPGIGDALKAAVDTLIDFPYGCTEQTVSRAIPALLLASVPRQDLLSAAAARKLPTIVGDSLARLRKLRHADGGWGWWESDTDDPFMTAYVLHGLSLQRTVRPNTVPDDLWKGAQTAATALAPKAPVARRAFLALALAESGQPAVGRTLLVAIAKVPLSTLGADTLATLVLTARRVGVDPNPLWAELQRRAKRDASRTWWVPSSGDWDTNERLTTALGLIAMLEMDPQDPRAGSVLRFLMAGRTESSFGNTRDTAFVVEALWNYLRVHPEALRPSSAPRLVVNGTPVPIVSAAGEETVVRVPAALLHPGTNRLQLSRSGAGDVFYAGTLREAIVADPKTGELPPRTPDGVIFAREVLRVGDTYPTTRFAQNDPVIVRLTVTTSRALEYVFIEDLFPAGFEPSERGSAETDSDGTFWYSNLDVRDDRIAVFVRRLPAGKHTLEYHLKAQTPGTYRALPARLSPMYADGPQAESRALQLDVSP
jgi:uncharacterized protein YfaS (alpha-2-macroglobulin family)